MNETLSDKIVKESIIDLQEYIGSGLYNASDPPIYLQTAMLAIQALEKQVPRKPIFEINFSDTCSRYHCKCGKKIKIHHDSGILNNNDAPKYCENCGQRLDWSDDNETD